MKSKHYCLIVIMSLSYLCHSNVQIWNKIEDKREITHETITKELKPANDYETHSKVKEHPSVLQSHSKLKIEYPIIINGPNENFIQLKLDGINSLARFGIQNDYNLNRKNKEGGALSSEDKSTIKKHLKALDSSTSIYGKLLQLKIMTDLVEEMDRTAPIQMARFANYYQFDEGSDQRRIIRSSVVQELLIEISKQFMTDKAIVTYFGDPIRGMDYHRNTIRRFGGIEASNDVFLEREKYQQFISDNLVDLMNVCEQLPTKVYAVARVNVETYDFDTESFPVRISLYDAFDGKVKGKYFPTSSYEDESYDKKIKFSLPIPLADAKTLKEKISNERPVAVIQYEFSSSTDIQNEKYNRSQFDRVLHYRISSPQIKLYLDDNLDELIYTHTLK